MKEYIEKRYVMGYILDAMELYPEDKKVQTLLSNMQEAFNTVSTISVPLYDLRNYHNKLPCD